MSVKHPIISVTGSSGAGTSTVKHTFQQIFRRESVSAATIEGDAFHKYDRESMNDHNVDNIMKEVINKMTVLCDFNLFIFVKTFHFTIRNTNGIESESSQFTFLNTFFDMTR